MKHRTTLAVSSLAAALLLGQQPAYADSRVFRDYQFDLSDINRIEIRGSAGTIEVLPARGRELTIELEIECGHDNWFRGTRDVSDVELISKLKGDRLILDQTEDDTTTNWIIRLPQVEETEITLGFGEIIADLHGTELQIDLGFGQVSVDYPLESAGDIDISAGIGDASIKGIRNVRSKRAFMSQDISAEGDGELDIEIKVGAGDIRLDLI